jgi:tetratricopeptide (TPR) repeat protein
MRAGKSTTHALSRSPTMRSGQDLPRILKRRFHKARQCPDGFKLIWPKEVKTTMTCSCERIRQGRGFPSLGAAFGSSDCYAAIGFQALAVAVLFVSSCGWAEALDLPDARREFESYMSSLQDAAHKEGGISPCEHGSDAFAAGVCKSQNLAEQGRFREAASILSGLVRDASAPFSREELETRIRILKKWSESGPADIQDYRRFYLDTGPDWFRTRTRPIIVLWQDKRFADKDKYFLLAALLERKGDMKGEALALLVLADLPRVDEATSARALLAAANALYESGDFLRAEQSWLRVGNSSHNTSAWPKAVFNLGLLEERRNDFSRAVSYFDAVLKSHPNDKEPGSNIMETNRNYSNRCAWQISMCYEGMGNYREALRYAWLAKTRYRYVSWCGTCQQAANLAIDKRIAHLAFRTYRYHALTATALAGAVIFLIRRMRRKKNEPNFAAGEEKMGL